MILPFVLIILGCLPCSVKSILGPASHSADSKFCHNEAKNCASSKVNSIADNMGNFYFRTGCRHYKKGLDCLYELQKRDRSCTVTKHPSLFQEAKNALYGATLGLCGADGSIDGCAYDFETCMDYVDKIREPNSNTTCSDFIKMSDCVKLTLDQQLCPPVVENRLSDELDTLKLELQLECFRTCDLSLDLCITDVPYNLTLDNQLTEGEQEVLCAEIETAIDCLNATIVEDLCEQEEETEKWKVALKNQTSHYAEFCSVPAKTCLVELQSCSTDLNAIAARGVSSPQAVQELCQELETAIECVDRTSLSEFCKGKNGARLLATTLNQHRHEMDRYCDPSVAQN